MLKLALLALFLLSICLSLRFEPQHQAIITTIDGSEPSDEEINDLTSLMRGRSSSKKVVLLDFGKAKSDKTEYYWNKIKKNLVSVYRQSLNDEDAAKLVEEKFPSADSLGSHGIKKGPLVVAFFEKGKSVLLLQNKEMCKIEDFYRRSYCRSRKSLFDY